MKQPSPTPVSPPPKDATVDRLYRRVRQTASVTEDEALNAVCDSRLQEPRRPLEKLLKKLENALDK